MTDVIATEEIRGDGKRRIHYGTIFTYDDGSKVYLARRKHKHIFKSGEQSISQAQQKETAAWAIDEALLYKLRAKGVTKVGVIELDTDDVYMADIKVWFNSKTSKLRDYTGIGRGGSRQRYVPFQHLDHTKSLVTLDASKLY